MITLHHLENSRSLRILWLLEELGFDYQLVQSVRDPKTMLGPEEQANIHPSGGWPVIEDGSVTLAETGAITEYLITKAGADEWRPGPDSPHYTDYLYWLHFAEATLQPLSVMSLIFSRLPHSAPALVRPILNMTAKSVHKRFIHPRVERHLAAADAHLAQNTFFAGDHLSGADVLMIFALETSVARFPKAKRYGHVIRYIREIQSRPAYQKALADGGRYDYVLA